MPVSGSYTVVVDPAGTRLGTVDVRLYTFTHDTQPLVPGGTPVTVALTTPGRNALLPFTGVEGQRVSLVGSEGTIRW